MTAWTLKRTKQCAKCPWRVDVDPTDIPNGYDIEKHKALASTIAKPGDVTSLFQNQQQVMACHETHDAHCIGWLVHQLGPGNNIFLRMQIRNCSNIEQVEVFGDQHERFEDTIPDIG